MPTVYQYGVVFPPLNDFLNLRCIKSAKSSVPRGGGNVLQERTRIPFKQGHIPIEFHAKPRAGLLLRRRLVAVVDVEV
jgi:hypothetical protein